MILLKSPSKSIFRLTLIGCVILLALPANDAVDPLVLRSAAVILLAIGLWSTAVVPSFIFQGELEAGHGGYASTVPAGRS